MSVAIVTGSGGLIGSETVKRFHREGFDVIGIDNDMRSYFFGEDASTKETSTELAKRLENYRHELIDIRDANGVMNLFAEFGRDIKVVVHTAAQPSHDWAAKEPFTDFGVNATGTLHMLEACRQHCPDAAFIFTSTNKVYGDTPNRLPLVELEERWEVEESHPFFARGIDEGMSIDQTKHSVFGASKAAADLMVQEYGRYFGIPTACFRGGCLTGPAHAGAELHGFLAYLMKCTVEERPYRVFGYKGKQVRDNIHSADLVEAFVQFVHNPRPAAVYNIGGGRHSNCSMREAIRLCEEISGKQLRHSYVEDNRIGDHIWWVSDTSRFEKDYPDWSQEYSLTRTLREIHDACLAS